ncbi:hypothetical protein ACIQU5_06140 [Streptomyces sp. NPDC090306]|uniref:hypothetical protein n=1 Tax=Streptomyces sp. NPDC090306 TaxID=3365961 RepID=UPI00381BCE71
MLGLLGAIERRAGDASTQLRKEILAVGAEGAEFAGWLYRDVRLPYAALYWYDRAMEWAQEAGDYPMQGYVLLKKSQMAYDERDPVRLLGLAEAARNRQWDLPSRVRAEVVQQEALGQAMLGAPFETVQRLLDASRELLETSSTAQPSELGSYFNHDTREVRNAVTLTEAGKPSLAADVFADVLSGGRLSHRDTGFFNARRAGALALSGEPDEAARVGALAAGVAAEVKSQRTVHVLGDVLHSLSPWRTRPAVRSLREALVAL